MKTREKLLYVEERWDDQFAKSLDGVAVSRNRSDSLGSDLHRTNSTGHLIPVDGGLTEAFLR